jgi:hypothetical protein
MSVYFAPRDNLRLMQPGEEQRRAFETWSRKDLAVFVFCACFLGVQIVVPIVKLTEPRPARFGWQMWSARAKPHRFFLVMKDGTTRPADLSRYIGWSRGELDLRDRLPPHLCHVVPDVTAVQIQSPGSETRNVYTCR